MNNTDPVCFGEYNTMNDAGTDITPDSNIIKSHGGDFQTILTAEEASEYSYEKMFPQAEKAWDPASLTVQADAPADAKYDNGTISWKAANDAAIGYALFKNGVFVAYTDGTSYNLTVNPEQDELTIRSANMMGGLGAEAHVAGTTGIKSLQIDNDEKVIYNLQGIRVSKAGKGIYIINGKKIIK